MEHPNKSRSKEEHKVEEEDNRNVDELEGHDREEEPEIEQVEGYTMSTVYPPNPCERCVRTNKICKGIAGARCEYCKRLKQKCSNSTGPARGKHASPRKAPTTQKNNAAEQPTWQVRPKRKAGSSKPGTSQNGGLESEDERSDDGHEPPAKMNKKRRSGKTSSGLGSRSQLLKSINELESTARRLQTQTNRDLEKIYALASSLTRVVRELDDD